MGLKKWLGVNKPVSKFEFYFIFWLALIAFLGVSVRGGKKDRELNEKIHRENREEIRKEYKLDREIREDQHKFNIRIQKEINTLKRNCKVGKK